MSIAYAELFVLAMAKILDVSKSSVKKVPLPSEQYFEEVGDRKQTTGTRGGGNVIFFPLK